MCSSDLGNAQSNLVYDDTTGLYVNPLTGGYSYDAPTTAGNTSAGNAQSNLVYDDMTGMYINPLTGEYSYKKGGLMSLMRRK